MKIVLPLCLALVLCIVACNENAPYIAPADPETPSGSDEPESDYPVQRQVNVAFGTTIAGYYEALPASYTRTNNNYPVLISITGAGERGDGSPEQLTYVLKPYGPAQMIDNRTFPKDFFVEGKYYAYIVLSLQMALKGRASVKDIDEFITYVMNHYRVDKSRIYMTGISLGGGCVIDYVSEDVKYGEKIAAITPMAAKSISPDRDHAEVIADGDVPMWAFHSEFDQEVPSIHTRNMVNWVNEFSPGLARMTLFQDSSHICWRYSYNPKYVEQDSVNVYEWMLLHKRTQTQTDEQ